MSNREYDYLFKLVIIGNSGVGKSSVLLRFADDQFTESYLTTIGVDFRFKTLNIDTKNVKLQIWDTAGQERFRTITNAYYKGADGIVIVYDTTAQSSFDDIEKFWLNEIESYAEKNVELLLLGNKCDLDDKKQVNTEKVQEYAKARNMEFFETSAKTSESINQAFVTISKKLITKRDEQIQMRRSARKKAKQDSKHKSTGSQETMEEQKEEVQQSKKLQTQQNQQQNQQKKADCPC